MSFRGRGGGRGAGGRGGGGGFSRGGGGGFGRGGGGGGFGGKKNFLLIPSLFFKRKYRKYSC